MRVALLGLGEAGFTIHLPALNGLPGVTLAGACDADAARRTRVADRFTVPVFPTFQAMLRDARPDVVIIGTPPEAHVDGCLEALAAGAHVICEKPFVPSVADADVVLAAAAGAGRQVAVNHQFREMPIFRALRDEVSRAGAEQLAFVQIWQSMDMTPGSEAGWRGRMLHRTLFEAGVHLVDYAMALYGGMPVSVQAMTSAGGRTADASDAVVVATLEFSRGRLAQITQNRVSKAPRHYFEVRADLPTASLRASFGGRSRLSAGVTPGGAPHVRFEVGRSGTAWVESGGRRRTLARNPAAPMVAATRDVFRRTIDAFAAGTEPPTSGRAAREVIGVIAACYHSADTGRRIRLEHGFLEFPAGERLGIERPI